MTKNSPVSALVKNFHAHKPARIWSLIVTLYGDAIVPRGGSLWIGSLIEIMALFGVDSGHVRTAISRLSSDGWLSRAKRGRASHYRLSKSGEGEFLAATRRIYFADHPPFDGRIRMALVGPETGNAASLRRELKDAGCVALSPSTYVAIGDLPPQLSKQGVHILKVDIDDRARALAAAAWNLDAVASAYNSFIARFAPLADALDRKAPSPEEALVARTLMIHAFRRIVLRDPHLPAALLPPDWPEHAARALAARIYRQVVTASELFLDRHGQNELGPLPQPQPGFGQRFHKL